MLYVDNVQYNIIRKALDKIEDAYKQSNDKNIRNIVKDKTYYDLVSYIPGFDVFEECFNRCKMSNLYEVCELRDLVLQELEISKLPEITEKQVKKMFKKLPDKYIKQIYFDYNKRVQLGKLTYYSKQIDENTKIYIFYENGQFYSEICKTSLNANGSRELQCHLCNQMRKGYDIGYIGRRIKSKSDNYTSRMVSCCADNDMCNHDITQTRKIKEFFEFKENVKNEENIYSN